MKKPNVGPQTAGFIRNVAATLTATGFVVTLGWWALGPRIEVEVRAWLADSVGVSAEIIQSQQASIAEMGETLVNLTSTTRKLSEEVAQMQDDRIERTTPPVQFSAKGNSVSTGRIGGVVYQSWLIRKERDCGIPRSRAYFVNGGGRTHLFRDKSNADEAGYVAPLLVDGDWQRVSFSARIPDNEGVQPTSDADLASAFLVVDWPEKCPNVPPLRSPEVPFRILE